MERDQTLSLAELFISLLSEYYVPLAPHLQNDLECLPLKVLVVFNKTAYGKALGLSSSCFIDSFSCYS